MATNKVTDASFETDVIDASGPVLVDFWAEWCGPCKMMGPVFKQVAAGMPYAARFAKVNTELAQNTAARFNIRSIPTLIVMKDGKEIDRLSGALPAPQLKQWIDGALAKA